MSEPAARQPGAQNGPSRPPGGWTFVGLLDRIVDIGMAGSVLAITLMMLHICLELFVRAVLNTSLEAVPEIVAFYYMPALNFFALAYVTRADGHVAAQIFTQGLKPRVRELLDGVIILLLCAFMTVLTWQFIVEASTMTRVNEIYQSAHLFLPKWPGRWFLVMGSAIMALYCLVLGIRKLIGTAAAPSGRPPAVLD